MFASYLVRVGATCVLPLLLWSCGSSSSPTRPSATCTLTIPQTTIEVGFAGGNNSILVSTSSSCVWNATASQAFLTITSANGTGPGSVNFSVAENTGAARTGTITVGTVVVTINQAAAPPAINFGQPVLGAATVGAAYSYQFSANGGVGTLRYSQQPGTFLPIGMTMDANGRLSGAPIAPGTSTFGVCVTDDTARSVCRAVTLVVNPVGTTDSPVLGNWAGNITVNTGCVPGLPRTVTWSGTFRRASNNSIELVVSIPFASVSNESIPVNVSGQSLTFSIQVDSRYDFTATFSSDFRSLTGAFAGANCAPAPATVLPGGTWNGTKQ